MGNQSVEKVNKIYSYLESKIILIFQNLLVSGFFYLLINLLWLRHEIHRLIGMCLLLVHNCVLLIKFHSSNSDRAAVTKVSVLNSQRNRFILA